MNNKTINQGFFTSENLHEINNTINLEAAKNKAFEIIDRQPNAKESNIKKAKLVVVKARSKNDLLIALGNFMLSHPSENLGMNTKCYSKENGADYREAKKLAKKQNKKVLI